MRSLLPLVLLASTSAAAAPPVDLPPLPSAHALKQPIRVPIATCAPPEAAPPANLSATALLDELRRLRTRIEELQERRAEAERAVAELAQERAQVAAEWERLAAAQLDFDLARAEQHGPAPRLGAGSAGEATRVAGWIKQMKPAKAAELLARLDLSLATEVVRGLSGKSAAALLERLPPERAASIAARLALQDPPPEAL